MLGLIHYINYSKQKMFCLYLFSKYPYLPYNRLYTHMFIISGIIFVHQWQHSQADSDQTSIKRYIFQQCGYGLQLSQKTMEMKQQHYIYWIDNPVLSAL